MNLAIVDASLSSVGIHPRRSVSGTQSLSSLHLQRNAGPTFRLCGRKGIHTLSRTHRLRLLRAENQDGLTSDQSAEEASTASGDKNTTPTNTNSEAASLEAAASSTEPSKADNQKKTSSSAPWMAKLETFSEFFFDPAQQYAALVAASKAFLRGSIELFKLAILLPFKYLFLAPVSWLLLKLGVTGINPNDVFDKIDAAHKQTPLSADKLAAVLSSLATRHPKDVAEFIETRCLSPTEAAFSTTTAEGGDSAAVVLPVNAAVVKTYLAALVSSGRIKEYGDDVDAVPAAGAAHRSLPLLLKELQAAAGGEAMPNAPGIAPSRPLHIVVNGGVGAYTSTAPTGLLGTLQSWFWFFVTCMAISFTWTVGAAAVRRYNHSGGSGIGNSTGMGRTSSMSGSSTVSPGVLPPREAGENSIFGAKEYSKENMPEKSVKSFKDVKGCDEAVAELEEIVEYLKTPEKFTKLGGKLPKGVLLTGQPGTGKTLLARAVAGEAGVPFFYKAGSEFDEMFVGVGSRRVRNLFAAAKKKAPCIVFIDEIDAVGGKRSNWEASGGSRKTLNQLLTEMDGFEDNNGVVVIAATNLQEMLDPALTRPGRFDRMVAVPLPDVNGRKQILDLYLTNKPLSTDVDAELLARRTPGFSGAQLFNLVNEAALLAARQDADSINSELLDEARDKVLMGNPRALAQSDEARRLTAYHEGGHALVALYTKGAKPIHKATIVPRGHALGMVSQVPDKDEYSTTKQQMVAHIDVCMGGKAAEELIFGEDYVTSGATSDLKTATRLARHMVEDCGMSDRVGPMAIDTAASGYTGQGEDIRKAVDQEVSSMLKGAYERVANLLKAKESELHALAAALLEKETLTQAQIKEVLWGTTGTDGGIGQEESDGVGVLGAAVPAVVGSGTTEAAAGGTSTGDKSGTAAPTARTAASTTTTQAASPATTRK